MLTMALITLTDMVSTGPNWTPSTPTGRRDRGPKPASAAIFPHDGLRTGVLITVGDDGVHLHPISRESIEALHRDFGVILAELDRQESTP
jgi:hypothetical protein